ncbi:hypothetical protein V5E97_23120 [Singulisphaera sp. Ch08]|uniref:Uncharacterized protein n=1 Tax=Singulisphaera sp. Ch08 TaxID=3120278 RepID=A0AAU7C7V4_9BACT
MVTRPLAIFAWTVSEVIDLAVVVVVGLLVWAAVNREISFAKDGSVPSNDSSLAGKQEQESVDP